MEDGDEIHTGKYFSYLRHSVDLPSDHRHSDAD